MQTTREMMKCMNIGEAEGGDGGGGGWQNVTE